MSSFGRVAIAAFIVAPIVCGLAIGAGSAQDAGVPIMVRADGDLDTCGVGQVTGLNPKGDNFLAVRAGPGASYKIRDKLSSGMRVWMFDQKGNWIGVVYGSKEIGCPPIKRDKVYDGPGKSGWVYKKYVRLIAG